MVGLASAANATAAPNATANATTAAPTTAAKTAGAAVTAAPAPKLSIDVKTPCGKAANVPYKSGAAAATTAATTAAAGNATNASRRLMEVRELGAAETDLPKACASFLTGMWVTHPVGRAAMETAFSTAAGAGISAFIPATAKVTVASGAMAGGFLKCDKPFLDPVKFHGSAVTATTTLTNIAAKFTDDSLKQLVKDAANAMVAAVTEIMANGNQADKDRLGNALGYADGAIPANIVALATAAKDNVIANIDTFAQSSAEFKTAAVASSVGVTASPATGNATTAAATSGSQQFAFAATGVLAALASLL